MSDETVLDRIRNTIEQTAPVDHELLMPIKFIALLIEDPRISGPALADGIEQQVRLAIGESYPKATRQKVLCDLASRFELQNRLEKVSFLSITEDLGAEATNILRDWFPWPAQKYEGTPDQLDQHFTCHSTSITLNRMLEETRPHTVLEIGVWLGGTTKQFVEAGVSNVISVDTWLGSEEHQNRTAWADRRDDSDQFLGQLYDQFITNLWDHRERIIPIRSTGIAAMHLLQCFCVAPELIFVDGSHDEVSVRTELDLAHRLFPNAPIVCDDYAPDEQWLGGLVRAANAFSKDSCRDLIFCEGRTCVLPPAQLPNR